MFKFEVRLMWALLIGPIILGLLAALVLPLYLGRARIRNCEKAGGTWNHEQSVCVKAPESN